MTFKECKGRLQSKTESASGLVILVLFLFLSFNSQTSGQEINDRQNIYYHDRPPSFSSRLLQDMMGKSFLNERLSSKIKENNSLTQAAPIPKSLKRKYNVSTTEMNGRNIWIINSKNNELPDKTILYLHGGAYFFNLLKVHWFLIADLLDRSNVTFIVPDYPLAPENNYEDVYAFMGDIYKSLLSDHKGSEIIIMGDSAGGGLALGFTQFLRDQNSELPAGLILISPWLDVSMDNPDIDDFSERDMVLDIKWLRKAGEIYADDIGTKDYRVSPIYGNFREMPEISVFIGTNDILAADCRKLKDILLKEDIPFNYFEYPGMFHVWPAITFMKEARFALGQMADLINRQN